MAKVAINELLHGQQKATQLRSLLQELSPVDNRQVVELPAIALINEIMGSITKAISILELDPRTVVGAPIEAADTRCSDEQVTEISSKKRKNPVPRRSGYRRRSDPYTSSKVLSETMEDAYTWRKYGQKDIYNAKHPRHYFRCTHKFDRGCQATRQVQKNDEGIFEITYLGEHTCMDHNYKTPTSTYIINFEASKEVAINDNNKLDEHLSPVNPPPKQELSTDEEVLSCLTPCSPSEPLMFDEFPEFDACTANALAQLEASTLDQCDVTSSLQEFNPDAFFLDLISYEI